jgi:hypothetical protein
VAIKKKKRKDDIQKAIDFGVDVQMLEDNLKRSVSERIKRHQQALDFLNILKKAKRV